jgi:hypothetical protein
MGLGIIPAELVRNPSFRFVCSVMHFLPLNLILVIFSPPKDINFTYNFHKENGEKFTLMLSFYNYIYETLIHLVGLIGY